MNIALQNFFWQLVCTFTSTQKRILKKFLLLNKLVIFDPSKPSRNSGPSINGQSTVPPLCSSLIKGMKLDVGKKMETKSAFVTQNCAMSNLLLLIMSQIGFSSV